MQKLTFTMENYLETIYKVSLPDGARLTDIAEQMGVTKATANTAMSVLAEKNLISREKYQKIHLTPTGRKHAELISEKHRIIDRFFREVLQVETAVADRDACAIEHVISSTSVYAMQKFLDRHAGAQPQESKDS